MTAGWTACWRPTAIPAEIASNRPAEQVLLDRKPHDEGRPFARLASGGDVPLVAFDDPTAYGQADPRAREGGILPM